MAGAGVAADFWEGRYAESDRIWSGEPNDALVQAVADFDPGQALDLGCGEGGDSVWLAEHGWRVTAVDIAATAVTRAKDVAADRGIPAGRITWLVADLASWEPTAPYGLVSACFLHSPVDFPRADILHRAAGAVEDGGHLLVVAHAEPPPWSEDHQRGHPFLDPAKELADLRLEPAAWDIVVSDVRPRQATGPYGEPVTLRDSVLVLRRC